MLLFSTIFMSVLLLYALFIHSTRLLPTSNKNWHWKISREHVLELLWQLSEKMCRTLDKTLTYEVVYTEPIIQNFLSLIDHMSCSADTYVLLGGSNACADQLTNWDGKQKVGVRSITKKEATRLILIMTICSIGYCKSPQITEMWCQNKDFQWFILSSE